MSEIRLSPEQIMSYVEASLRIEGMKLPGDARLLAERMLNGEITYEDARDELLATVRNRQSIRHKRP